MPTALTPVNPLALNAMHALPANTHALTGLSELGEVQLQWLYILVESQCAHGTQEIIAVDGLPLLLQALVACSEMRDPHGHQPTWMNKHHPEESRSPTR